MDKKDVTIIGAGMGGLFTAALWAEFGYQVHLIESHYASGGCAGYFKRREGFYDVGATTISGLKKDRPLEILLRILQINLDTEKLERSILIIHPKFRFNYYADLNLMANEIDNIFGLNTKSLSFLKSLVTKEKMLWNCLNIFNTFPNIKFKQIIRFIFSKNIMLALSPGLFTKKFFEILPENWKRNENLISLIDQLLLISTQQNSKECPAFIGVLGFLYPRDTYHLPGGMRSLCLALENFIKNKGGEISFKNKVIGTESNTFGHRIQTEKNEFDTDILIAATMPSLISKDLQKEQKWTAMTAYLYFKEEKLKECHYQIHLNSSQRKKLDTESIFISASDISDTRRSPHGYQLITISTHAKKQEVSPELKSEFKNVILELLESYFDINKNEVFFDSVASARTFEYFTQRPQGEVGGIVINSIFDVFSLPANQFNKNTYLVGDYAFPGQGIVAVARGALNTLKL